MPGLQSKPHPARVFTHAAKDPMCGRRFQPISGPARTVLLGAWMHLESLGKDFKASYESILKVHRIRGA